MNASQPLTVVGRRVAGRALSGVRSAPYLRKWLILGTLIGVVAGLGAVVFYDGLHLATHLLLVDVGGYTPATTAGEGGYHAASGFSRPWAIPLVVGGGGLVAGILVFWLAPEAEGHGTDAAIKAVHANPKGVRPRVIGVKLVASAITIGSGGSGGREGPTAQISSGFGSVLARTLNLTPADSRLCVAAGVASGIGAIFRAPFGGALLGVELLYTDDVEIEALIPSVVATVVGYVIFGAITGSFTPVFGAHADAQVAHAWEYLLFIALGLFAGAMGWLYTKSFYGLADWFAKWPGPRALRPAVAGVVVGLVGLAIPGVLGTGYGELQTELGLHTLLAIPLYLVILIPLGKLLATSLTIGSGGSAGIFGPGMVIGGASGAIVWRVLHLLGLAGHDQIAFVIVGMAACFGAIAHAPIAVMLMVAEMTGSLNLLPPAMVALAFSMLVVGETTIYRSQLRRRSDSSAHRFDLGIPAPSSVPVTTLMNPPRLVLSAATPAAEALARLQGEQLPGAPVVNTDGAFIGSIQTPRLAELVAGGEHGAVGRIADVEAMTLPVEAGFDAAVEALPASKGGWVPVLDDQLRVVGILATQDLVRGWRQAVRQSVRRLVGTTSGTVVVDTVIPAGSPLDGTDLGEVPLPPGAVIVSMTREGAWMFPERGQQLRAGDSVSLLVRRHEADAARAWLAGEAPAPATAAPPAGPAPTGTTLGDHRDAPGDDREAAGR